MNMHTYSHLIRADGEGAEDRSDQKQRECAKHGRGRRRKTGHRSARPHRAPPGGHVSAGSYIGFEVETRYRSLKTVSGQFVSVGRRAYSHERMRGEEKRDESRTESKRTSVLMNPLRVMEQSKTARMRYVYSS